MAVKVGQGHGNSFVVETNRKYCRKEDDETEGKELTETYVASVEAPKEYVQRFYCLTPSLLPSAHSP